MEGCIRDVKTWLANNGLILNETKSQAIVIRSSSLRAPITSTCIDMCGELVATSAVVMDSEFVIDANLSMASQVAKAYRSAYYDLVRITHIRDSMIASVCKCLVHAFVTPRIDYGNAYTRPPLTPSGAAVGGTNRPPDPMRGSTIGVRGIEAVALASRDKAHRVQGISPCTL